MDTSESRSVSLVPPATGSSTINIGNTERILSVIGGLALTGLSLRSRKSTQVSLLLSGGYLLARGLSGFCVFNNMIGRNSIQKNATAIEASLTFVIDKPRDEIYAFWRRLENLPQFMKHLTAVKEKDSTHSTWTARVPGGLGTISWEAEILEDVPNEYISWQSLPGSTIDNAGEILFTEMQGISGTEVSVCISYRLPGGDIGSVAAKFINPVVESLLIEDLNRFRNFMEKGEVPDVENGSQIKQYHSYN